LSLQKVKLLLYPVTWVSYGELERLTRLAGPLQTELERKSNQIVQLSERDTQNLVADVQRLHA